MAEDRTQAPSAEELKERFAVIKRVENCLQITLVDFTNTRWAHFEEPPDAEVQRS